MAADITVFSSATRTTTTKTEDKVQPREIDAEAVGASVDLADNRSCSVELVATMDAAYRSAVLEVAIETSEDDGAAGGPGWREVARFTRYAASNAVHKERLSFTADRYIRGRYRIARTEPDKGGVSFSVTGRAVGSAT